MAVGWLGCATPTVVEYPLVNAYPEGFLVDGPPASEVLAVRNHQPQSRMLKVVCGSVTKSLWEIEVPAHTEIRGLIQLNMRDVGASTCHEVP